MNNRIVLMGIVITLTMICAPPLAKAVTTPVLGSAEDYAVLAHTAVTNTGPTVVYGSASTLANVGVWEAGANAISGFNVAGNTFVGAGTYTDGPGLVNAPGSIHGGDGPGSGSALNARNDLITGYTALATYTPATPVTDLTGHDLGTSGTLNIDTLVAGVYSFASTAQLNGALQLDAQGTDGGVWIFQVGTELTTASASSVELINVGLNGGSDVGVFWVLGTSNTPGLGSATLGTGTAFEGNIMALTSITLTTGASISCGRALAINGAVTLDTNVIGDGCQDIDDLPFNVSGPGSSAPNSGPGFSGGIGFDTETGMLMLTGPADNGGGNDNGSSSIPEPTTAMLAACGLSLLMVRRSRRPSEQS